MEIAYFRRMKKWLLLLFAFAAIFPFCNAQKIVLDGFYKSHNIYILNPQTGDGSFCTEKLYVNGVKTPFENASAFQVRLDTLGLRSGDPLKIEIYHKMDCKPRVIVESDYPSGRTFDMVSIAFDKQGVLHWTTKNETSNRPYIVEQYKWNKWVAVAEVESKGGTAENDYSQSPAFHSGTNKFRIKQVSALGQITLSMPVEFTPAMQKVVLLSNRKKIGKEIAFSVETMFEIYDRDGYKIKSGTAKTIDCSTFENGTCFLNFDSQMAEITKLPDVISDQKGR